MTELYIDRQPVVLPQDFSWEFIAENPLFTKNGKHTLDITLSLLNPENAKIYRHYNRTNNREEIAHNRPAFLIADNDVLLNGTEIIMEITDREVKIQLVSGESELNYFIGSDKKLNELNIGTFDVFATEEAADVFLPVFSSNEETVYNEQRISDYNNIIAAQGVQHPLIQPKLSFLVKRIVSALGYGIESSVLEQGFLQYLRVLNGRKTVKYSEMLPDWTVAEFFTELENLFNISFIINEQNKTVSILLKNDYYKTAPKIFAGEVTDEFIETVDRENKLSHTRSNIGYELTDDVYFKCQKLDKTTIIDRAKTMTFPAYEDIKRYLNNILYPDSSNGRPYVSEAEHPRNVLFYATDTGTQYAHITRYSGNAYAQLEKVNVFKDITGNPDSPNLDISLKIIPAPIRPVEIPVYDTRDANTNNVLYYMVAPLPVTETDEGDDLDYIVSGSEEEDYLNIQTVLGISEESRVEHPDEEAEEESYVGAANRMFIFFYTGRHDIFALSRASQDSIKKVQYPVGFVDFLCEDQRFGERIIDDSRPSLRLDSVYGLKPLYDSVAIDTVREYTFKFIYRGKMDAKAIFVFGNKKYICKQLKYRVTSEGINPLVEGSFYPTD